MVDKIQNDQANEFFEAVVNLKTLKEAYSFFDDMCTEREIKSMVQRFEVAKMLIQGYVYTEIATTTGASTATISRVKRCLSNGGKGYKIGMNGLKK